jgi:hypothetical protein
MLRLLYQGISVIQQLMSMEISSLHQDDAIVKSFICYGAQSKEWQYKTPHSDRKNMTILNIVFFLLHFACNFFNNESSSFEYPTLDD